MYAITGIPQRTRDRKHIALAAMGRVVSDHEQVEHPLCDPGRVALMTRHPDPANGPSRCASRRYRSEPMGDVISSHSAALSTY